MAIYTGTSDDDRIRAGNTDDTILPGAGNDNITGGGGVDTVVFEGSVFDYAWSETNQGLRVRDWNTQDGDMGTDTISGVEWMQFDDALIEVGVDAPSNIVLPDEIRVTVGDTVSTRFIIEDLDEDVHYSLGQQSELQGLIQIRNWDNINGWEGERVSFDFIVNTTPGEASYSFTPEMTALALGEEMTITWDIDYAIGSGLTSELEWTTHVVDITYVGLNDAPEVTKPWQQYLYQRPDRDVKAFDLSTLADDIDSDDDGTTLTYEINWSSPGYDVWIEGHTLYYAGAEIPVELSADEIQTGWMGIRVTDQHGAEAGDLIRFKLDMAGENEVKPVYVKYTGLDKDALGITDDDAIEVGAWIDWYLTEADVPLLQFSDNDDVRFYTGTDVSGFQRRNNLEDENGVELIEELGFFTGKGNDVLIFELTKEVQPIFSSNDIFMGDGEDIFSLRIDGVGEGALPFVTGLGLSTGRNDDQVSIWTEGDGGVLLDGYIGTGSGNDLVDIRAHDPNEGNLAAFAETSLDIYLGTGNDTLRYVIDTGPAQLSSQFDANVYAGDGDDRVWISTERSEEFLVEPPVDLPGWENPSRSGFEGEIFMGSGHDVLSVAFNTPTNQAAYGTMNGGWGYDKLNLYDLSLDEIDLDVDGTTVTINYALQTLVITGFEEIWLADGVDVFDL